MQNYLLATTFFALATLFLDLDNFTLKLYERRLWILFLLVISQALSLLATVALDNHLAVQFMLNALMVFSTFCMVWALTGSLTILTSAGRRMTQGVAITSMGLALLPLLPIVPIPAEIYSMVVVIASLPLVVMSNRLVRWPHLAAMTTLIFANFFGFMGLTSVSWLLAYVFLIRAIHWENLQHYFQQAEQIAERTFSSTQIQRRIIDVSQILSRLSQSPQMLDKLTRNLAQITQSDQALLILLDPQATELAHIATQHSTTQHTTRQNPNRQFHLSDFPAMDQALAHQTPLILSADDSDLQTIMTLWQSQRAGPTLLQPLMAYNHPVGLLVLTNPISQRPIRANDAALCQVLALQIALMIEQYQQTVAQQKRETQLEAIDVDLNEYLSVFEMLQEAVVVSNRQGRVEFSNRSAEHILGKTRRELLGMPIGTIYGALASDEAVEDTAISFSRQNKPIPTFLETEHKAIAGQLIPWRNHRHDWLGIVAVFKDVTREVKTKAQQDSFIAALSHELRGSLTVVKGYSDLIVSGGLPNYSESQLELQRIIQASTDRMTDVLDNVVHVSAYNKTLLAPEFDLLDIMPLLKQVVTKMEAVLEAHQLQITMEIADSLPIIKADRQQLKRILSNLISNACEFTLPGGQISIKAWAHSERFGYILRPEIIIVIKDNGVGIAEEELKHIFDPFYQAKGSQIRRQGMGMGLTVVKDLVDTHNGRINIDSVLHEGTTVELALPINQG